MAHERQNGAIPTVINVLIRLVDEYDIGTDGMKSLLISEAWNRDEGAKTDN